jgi:hypothetical protein
VLAAEETCDGLDNDCDGVIDDGALPGVGDRCTAEGAVGVCRIGQQACSQGRLVCNPGAPAAEACDGEDDDCNGAVDDNVPGEGSPCTAEAAGECQSGRRTCQAGVMVCVGGAPQQEVCNQRDDDCDGQTDEDNVCCPLGGEVVVREYSASHWTGGLEARAGYDDVPFEIPDGYGYDRTAIEEIESAMNSHARVAEQPATDSTGAQNVRIRWFYNMFGKIRYRAVVYTRCLR